MKISEIMTLDAQCISPETTLTSVAQKLRDMDVGALPICENDRLIGMVTDRDITVRGVAAGSDPDETTVRAIMTPGIVYAFEDQHVDEAARLMEEHQIRRLPILNRAKRLVGIISLGDIAMDCGAPDLTGHALMEISRPPAQGSDEGIRLVPAL